MYCYDSVFIPKYKKEKVKKMSQKLLQQTLVGCHPHPCGMGKLGLRKQPLLQRLKDDVKCQLSNPSYVFDCF